MLLQSVLHTPAKSACLVLRGKALQGEPSLSGALDLKPSNFPAGTSLLRRAILKLPMMGCMYIYIYVCACVCFFSD